MSDPLNFGPDTGLRELWLFALHVSNDDLGFWEPPRPDSPPDEWRLEPALGVGKLDPRYVQVFEADDLGRDGLKRFLVESLGMDEAQVEADAQKLAMLHGTAVVVHDQALTERPGTLNPQSPLRYIGHFSVKQSLTPAAPAQPRPATEGHIPGPTGPGMDGAKSRRALMLTILALAGAAALVVALV